MMNSTTDKTRQLEHSTDTCQSSIQSSMGPTLTSEVSSHADKALSPPHDASAGPDDTGLSGAAYGKAAGEGVHGVFRGIHGLGETIRGNVLGAVDAAFGNKEGAARYEEIARKGRAQMGQKR